MRGRHKDARIFCKESFYHDCRYVEVPIYYSPGDYKGKGECFFAEVDGERIEGKMPSEVKRKIPDALKTAFTYSEWGFWLKVAQEGGSGSLVYDDEESVGREGLTVKYTLLLLGTRSDGKRVEAPCHLSPEGVPHIGPAAKRERPCTTNGFRKVPYVCCKNAMTDPDKAEVGKAKEYHSYSSTEGNGLVTFTPERLARMKRLQDAVAQVRAKVDEVLDGGGRALAKRLDEAVAASSLPLLPSGTKGT